MTNSVFNFTIVWKSGNKSHVTATVQYDDGLVKDNLRGYRYFLRTVLNSILTRIGKNGMFPFEVEGAAVQRKRKNCYPYFGENLQVEIIGENPELFPMIEKGMQLAYKAEKLGKTVRGYSDEFLTSMKGFFESVGDFFGNIGASKEE